MEPHPLYGWTHAPGASGWAKRCVGRATEWRTFVRINSLGLRSPEATYERRDAFRILVLGDSFTEGLQVKDEETFSRRLEALLDRRGGAGCPIEVINAGHAGYTTTNELLFYLHEGRKYHADLVLLVFNTENDVLENSATLLRQIPFGYPDKPFFVYEGDTLVLQNYPMHQGPEPWATVDRARRVLFRHSMLYRFVRGLTLPRLVREAGAAESLARLGPLGALLRDYPPEWHEAWRITRVLLQRLQRAVEKDGSTFAVAVMGGAYEVSLRRFRSRLYLTKLGHESVNLDTEKPYRLITAWLRRREIPYVPIIPRLRAHVEATGNDGYYAWDPHWNAEGHAVAAEALSQGLVELGLVPDASCRVSAGIAPRALPR
jgi:lysophospholipase L1-like esterase